MSTSSVQEGYGLELLGGKDLSADVGNLGDVCSIPESGSSPGAENGNPFQYSYPENSTDRGV